MRYRNVNWDDINDDYKVNMKEEQKKYIAPVEGFSSPFAQSFARGYHSLSNGLNLPLLYMVLDKDKVVGFVHINFYPAKGDAEAYYELAVIMIDKEQQGKGYGKRVFNETMQFISTMPCGRADNVVCTYHKENVAMKNILTQYGFSETGELAEWGGIITSYPISSVKDDAEICFDKPRFTNLEQAMTYLEKVDKLPLMSIGDENGIHIHKICKDDFENCINLGLLEHQDDFVACNRWSLMEGYLDITEIEEDDTNICYAIKNKDIIIGFCKIYREPSNDFKGYYEYGMNRLMIDKKYQNKGYGRKALSIILDYLKTQPFGAGDFILITYEVENTVARKLYASYGFVEKGISKLYDEMMSVYKLSDKFSV